jgi:hypothetical protein
MRFLWPAICLLMCAAQVSCAPLGTEVNASFGQPYRALIRDQDTREPVPNALVWFTWQKSVANFPESFNVCYHLESGVGDSSGHVEVPSWEGYQPSFAYAYVRGYRVFLGKRTNDPDFYIEKFEGTPDMRFDYLASAIATTCGLKDGSRSKLADVRRAVQRELSELAKTDKQRETARSYDLYIRPRTGQEP